MFNEETGEPVPKRGGKRGDFEPRRTLVPCETLAGCKKGHWKQFPDLSPRQLATIDLYYAAKATGGAILNEKERSDWWLAETFGRMRELEDRAAEMRNDAMALRLAVLGRQPG